MTLYHGSYMAVEKPDLVHSRPNVDFGRGFYTTPILEQAVKWCGKFKRRGEIGILSKYTLNEVVFEQCKILEFISYSDEWLDFILSCRSGKDETDYDIVIGGVANDRVFNTVELYIDRLIDKAEAIRRLRYEKPNLQVCIRTQEIMDQFLSFEGSEKI